MHAVAQKHKQPSQRATPDSAKSSLAKSLPLHQRYSGLDLQRTVGNQAVLRLLQQTKGSVGSAPGTFERAGPGPGVGTRLVDNALPLKIQPNLAMSTPGDADEREAERLADTVMALPAAQTHQGQGETIGGQLGLGTSQQPGSSPAHPLHQSPRRFMESRFGHDFSQVRVHADANAAESARTIHALAFTLGRDIVFGAGQYAPNTHRGLHLLAHELAHVVRHGNHQAVVHRQADQGDAKPTQPTLYKVRPGVTDRIEDAYGAGSLDEPAWRALVADAEQAIAEGRHAAAQRAYLTLYADVAKLAQATRVVSGSGAINIVTGGKNNCRDAKPGLNLSLGTKDNWGANATTALVDDQGRFGVVLSKRGGLQPDVAIVLTRSAFKPEKELTLGTLRHEMVHAEHDAEDAANAFLSDPTDTSDPVRTTLANSELLGYTEGFTTMFPLTRPAPTAKDHPAFVQLLGALDTGDGVYPWADADPTVRSDALGRLQECYCHALDAPHRESFESWVAGELASARRDRFMTGESSRAVFAPGGVDDKTLTFMQKGGGDVMGASIRNKQLREHFFRSLQGVFASNCKPLTPPSMKL